MKQRIFGIAAAGALCAAVLLSCFGCAKRDDSVLLRISSWEEYIDLGDWDEEDAIPLANPFTGEDSILGVRSMIEDFTDWFNAGDYGFRVSVEYSTYGTNEDLYNRLTLGDVYDLVCPSEYMIMKLLSEQKIQPFSPDFKDKTKPGNYYAANVSDSIDCGEDSIFAEHGWEDYTACYMWGTTGLVYNPEELVEPDDVRSLNILLDPRYKRRVTIKDNVRDSYFATLGLLNADALASADAERRTALLNATDPETVAQAERILKDIKNNVYAFETDNGKADMATGKIVANYQWSGDGVFGIDQAEEQNGIELWYSVPDECTDLYFDGWTMLKDGIAGDERKQIAAEAFINFVSRPDNVIRNMDYIGYTSAIADELVFDYVAYRYGAELDPESEAYTPLSSLYAYDLSFFFGHDATLYVDPETLEIEGGTPLGTVTAYGIDYPLFGGGTINRGRQLFAQYPPQNILDRCVIMLDFGDRLADINQMWINVRCLDLKDIDPALFWGILCAALAVLTPAAIYFFRNALPQKKPAERTKH